jgi:hypothetical protein
MSTKSILSISLIAVLLLGVMSFDNAFAAEKTTICHLPDSDKPKTMDVKDKKLQNHLGHGDTEGACPTLNDMFGLIALLQAAIEDLQDQINNISSTPGPQGEAGEQGIQGEAGEQGIQGEAGEQGIQGEAGIDATPYDDTVLEARITALENTSGSTLEIVQYQAFEYNVTIKNSGGGVQSVTNLLCDSGLIQNTITANIVGGLHDGKSLLLRYVTVDPSGHYIDLGVEHTFSQSRIYNQDIIFEYTCHDVVSQP